MLTMEDTQNENSPELNKTESSLSKSFREPSITLDETLPWIKNEQIKPNLMQKIIEPEKSISFHNLIPIPASLIPKNAVITKLPADLQSLTFPLSLSSPVVKVEEGEVDQEQENYDSNIEPFRQVIKERNQNLGGARKGAGAPKKLGLECADSDLESRRLASRLRMAKLRHQTTTPMSSRLRYPNPRSKMAKKPMGRPPLSPNGPLKGEARVKYHRKKSTEARIRIREQKLHHMSSLLQRTDISQVALDIDKSINPKRNLTFCDDPPVSSPSVQTTLMSQSATAILSSAKCEKCGDEFTKPQFEPGPFLDHLVTEKWFTYCCHCWDGLVSLQPAS